MMEKQENERTKWKKNQCSIDDKYGNIHTTYNAETKQNIKSERKYIYKSRCSTENQ